METISPECNTSVPLSIANLSSPSPQTSESGSRDPPPQFATNNPYIPRIQALLGIHTPRPSTGSSTSPSSRPPYPRTSSAPEIPKSPHYPLQFDAELYSYTSGSGAQPMQDEVPVVDSRTKIDPSGFSSARDPGDPMASQSIVEREEPIAGDDEEFLIVNKVLNAIHANKAYNKMDNINIVVIGAQGVGKSTLIQRALGLHSLPTIPMASLKMSVDNIAYTVTLIELDLVLFDPEPNRTITWPRQINGMMTPNVDGALLLYDVMNRQSILRLPQMLNALIYSALPTILVSCKCDNPVDARQVDTNTIEAACLTEVQTVKTASNVPESARLCLGSMLRLIMAARNSALESSPVIRKRAASSSTLYVATQQQRQQSAAEGLNSSPEKADSEYFLSKGLPPTPTEDSNDAVQSQITSAADQLPPSTTSPSHCRSLREGHKLESGAPVIRRSNTESKYSFLNMEESTVDSGLTFSTQLLAEKPEANAAPRLTGTAFDELVDRLLSQHMSKADTNFQDIFLCLYRRFAAPTELLTAILRRFDEVSVDTNIHYLTRTGIQLRMITVVAKWVTNYPGDFASPRSTHRLVAFVEQLSMEPAFAAAAKEIENELKTHVIEDDDTGWARSDAEVELELGASHEDVAGGMANMKIASDPSQTESSSDQSQPPGLERRASEVLSLASAESKSTAMSLPQIYSSYEDYEAEATTLVPASRLPLTKFRYHICMDISDDDFAGELTRIDWVMFSSIRVRDFVRDVSLSVTEKRRCRSLANVKRMINHFNHIARWVANMILMRDKAKHRAQMLEKFMRIAVKLRELNNYNGLAAVVAGINGSAVNRLSQTRALITPECHKRFMRLELLMGTQRSHFAYRLAWENSSFPRIPFIPLHRRDLVSAEEGSRTLVGMGNDRINWKKFEVLAEVLLPMMRSQGTPYPNLERHNLAKELILECRMPIDEEEIYQRSLLVEGASSGGLLDAGKRKFQWFQKQS